MLNQVNSVRVQFFGPSSKPDLNQFNPHFMTWLRTSILDGQSMETLDIPSFFQTKTLSSPFFMLVVMIGGNDEKDNE